MKRKKNYETLYDIILYNSIVVQGFLHTQSLSLSSATSPLNGFRLSYACVRDTPAAVRRGCCENGRFMEMHME